MPGCPTAPSSRPWIGSGVPGSSVSEWSRSRPASAEMSTATIALRTRPRPSHGPALGRSRLPITGLLLSALLHVSAVGGLVLTAVLWHEPPPKTYIVNLVP